MSNNWQEDVYHFHVKFKQSYYDKPTLISPLVAKLRVALIEEEIEETRKAIIGQNLTEIADGIVDSIYVLLGTANAFGIHIQPFWDIIHDSNMAKEGGASRDDGKILKPEGWVSPTPLISQEILRQKGDIK
jgi:predicted HAD superfamily Cof-like phosphohydrolase